jgi:hypothetical protein
LSPLAHEDRGSIALTTILLLPLLLVSTVGVLELGIVRLVAERARLAADLATVVAVNDQDPVELARTGSLRPAADADEAARAHFGLNLAPVARALAVPVDDVAAAADIAVFAAAGAVDPRTGRRYDGPTVRIAADLPIRTPAFGALLARPVTIVQLFSASSAR